MAGRGPDVHPVCPSSPAQTVRFVQPAAVIAENTIDFPGAVAVWPCTPLPWGSVLSRPAACCWSCVPSLERPRGSPSQASASTSSTRCTWRSRAGRAAAGCSSAWRPTCRGRSALRRGWPPSGKRSRRCVTGRSDRPGRGWDEAVAAPLPAALSPSPSLFTSAGARERGAAVHRHGIAQGVLRLKSHRIWELVGSVLNVYNTSNLSGEAAASSSRRYWAARRSSQLRAESFARFGFLLKPAGGGRGGSRRVGRSSVKKLDLLHIIPLIDMSEMLRRRYFICLLTTSWRADWRKLVKSTPLPRLAASAAAAARNCAAAAAEAI